MRFALHAPSAFLHYVFAFLLITLLALAMSDCPSLGNSVRVEAAVEKSEIVLVVMPKGDPVAGRIAFQKLSCNFCHAVPNDHAMPKPDGGLSDERSAPNLGEKRVPYSSGYEVTSILSPAHIVAFEYARKQDATDMPDMTATMTVKQLIDLLAYLRSVSPK